MANFEPTSYGTNRSGRYIIENPGSVDNIKEVIFSGRATIILRAEGVKTIVKCSYNDLDKYSRLKGFLIGYYQYICDYVYNVSKSEAMKYLYKIVDNKSDHIDNDMDAFIEKCIFNGLSTIVMWKYGKKTICRCSSLDSYDKETGFLMCFFKYHCGLSNTKIHNFLFDILSDPVNIESKQVARLKARFNIMKKQEPRAFDIRIERCPAFMYGRETWEVLIVFYDNNSEKKIFCHKTSSKWRISQNDRYGF